MDSRPAPFIVGVARSGTTLLRLMLDAHSELAIPPETHFVPELVEAAKSGVSAEQAVATVTSQRTWEDFGFTEDELAEIYRDAGELTPRVAVGAFFEAYAARHGKSRWGDKTPQYVRKMHLIDRALPEARFIHLIRDGRDVALSRQRRVAKQTPPDQVAERWAKLIRRARGQAPRLRHYTEVRYEDLVGDPEPELRRLCEFCELDFEPGMLRYHEDAAERLAAERGRDLPAAGARPAQRAADRAGFHRLTAAPADPARVGRWRTEMDPGDRREFERIAGDLLAELGYEVGTLK